MEKKYWRESVSLSSYEGKFIRQLKRKMGKGWFSEWVRRQIRIEWFEKYTNKPIMLKVLRSEMAAANARHLDSGKEVKRIAAKIEEIRAQTTLTDRRKRT